MKIGFFAFLAFLSLSCSDLGFAPEGRDFNVKLNYGIGARNELNTFRNSLTKDLILDGTISAALVLSESDLHLIRDKTTEVGFFSYPDTFVAVPRDSLTVLISPTPLYDFEIKYNSTVKRVHWHDNVLTSDRRAVQLRDLIALIRRIVESKPEYRRLPPARGSYL
jgi:hypothetical protein